jgi:flagellum-specific ATP synthase
MNDIVNKEVTQLASGIREILASYQETEDLLTIGAYKPGQNPRIDRAVAKIEAVNQFLRQQVDQPTSLEETWAWMQQVVAE